MTEAQRSRKLDVKAAWRKENPVEYAIHMKAAMANQSAKLKGCRGRLSHDDIRTLITEDFRCHYCGDALSQIPGTRYESSVWTIDHIVPLSDQGPNIPSNIVAACRSCNSHKGTKPAAQFVCELYR
jgi:5-methylcytosine-specific restriction endonuclease McrA